MAYHLDKEKEPTEEAKKEARIVINTIEQAKIDALQAKASTLAEENSSLKEAYKTAKMLTEKNYPSMFVEPVDEYTSQLFVVDEKGQRKDLGTIPTQKGLGVDNYTEKLMKKVEHRIKEREAQELEMRKTIAEAIGAMDKSSIRKLEEMAEELQKVNISAPIEALSIQVDNYFKNFSTAFEALTKFVENNPIYTLFLEELNALAEDPEYKGADLDRPSLDYVDEKENIEADTLHNKAIHLAMERAEVRLRAQRAQEKQEEQEEQPLLFDEQNIETLSKKNTTKVNAEAAATLLKALNKSLPPNYLIPNTNVIQDLQKPGAISPEKSSFVSKDIKRKGKQISNYVIAFYDEEALEDIKDIKGNPIKDRLSQEQIRIFNAVSTICENFPQDEQVFTLPRLSRIIKQTDETNLNEAEESTLARELWRLTGLNVNIDATETFSSRGLPLEKAKLKGKFLELRALEMDLKGGGSYTVYKITQPPIVYQHAKALGQIKTVPANVIDIREVKEKTIRKKTRTEEGAEKFTLVKKEMGEKVRLTSERLSIRDYLALRIEIMKEKNEDKAYHNVILFDDPKGKKGLYKILGKENADRIQKKRIRDFCFLCLDYWADIKYIKGYKIRTKGNVQEAIEIFL